MSVIALVRLISFVGLSTYFSTLGSKSVSKQAYNNNWNSK